MQMNYLSYWSLLRKPFVADDHYFFFAGTPQREALARLSEFVSNRMNLAALVAPAGCGMTSLLRHVQGMRGFDDRAAEVILTSGTQHHRGPVCSQLCKALGYPDQSDQAFDQVDQLIAESRQYGIQLLWLIDSCGSCAANVARDLSVRHSNLSVVAGVTAGQNESRAMTEDRIVFRLDLPALTLADTSLFLKQGVRHAGGIRSLFPDQTVRRIHQSTGGVLSDLAVIAESALALAARHQMDHVGPEMVEAIDRQLSRAA
jgi:type II secretory pathway predicted ATPase ExeA